MTDQEGNVVEISGPPAPQFDSNISLADVILSSLRKYHVKSIAEVEVETGRELTYGHLVRESLSVVQGLKSEGVTESTVVSVVSFNSQECHVFTLACIFIGATVAPIDPSLTAEEMAGLMDLVSPSVIFTEGGKTLKKVETALSFISISPLLVVSSGRKHSYMTFQALMHPTDPEFRPNISDPENHIAIILFTSGTSGLPKGVMLSDFYFLNSVPAMGRKLEVQPTCLLTSPVFWLTGILLLLTSIIGGLKLVFLRGPAKEAVVLSTIQNYRANMWFSSPTMLLSLLNFPSKNAYDLSSLVMVSSGGAILSADSALRIQKELMKNRIPILHGYGYNELTVTTLENNLASIFLKVNFWISSPTMLISLLNYPKKSAYDISSLRTLLGVGAILSTDSTLRIERELLKNSIQILQGYGMTEIGVITNSLPGLNKPGSCGVLRPGVSCKIVDLETQESLGPSMEGEICLKSAYMMKGYVNNPEATAATFDEDGWFRTGDVGYYDEDGFIFVVDRIKDLIKYKSYQIAPAEIENVLRTHPVVKDCAVFGIPHPTDGDHATAYVVASKAISENHLLEFVAERVSDKKQLRGGIRFVEFIPKTSTGKPKRRALRTQLLAELNGISFVKRPWTSATRAKKKPNKLQLLHSHSTWCST